MPSLLFREATEVAVEGGRARVHLVGAGPGDPGLLTVRAAELIASADDLVVDALVPPALYQDSPARVIYVGKRSGRPSIVQSEIDEILVRLALEGRRVVRLKGGDPGVFGRLAEEIVALAEAGVEFEIVPGVSSASAAAAALGIPITERDVADRWVVVTGQRRGGSGPHGNSQPVTSTLPAWDDRQTVVVLMGLGRLADLVAEAFRLGYPAELPVAVVSRATLTNQRSVCAPLDEIVDAVAEADLKTPATLLFGRVAERLIVRRADSVAQQTRSWARD